MSDIMDQLAQAHGYDDDEDSETTEEVETESEEVYESDEDTDSDLDDKKEDYSKEENDDDEYEVAEAVGYAGEDSDGYDVWDNSTSDDYEESSDGEFMDDSEESTEDGSDSEEDDDSSDSDYQEEAFADVENQIPTVVDVLGTNTAQAIASEFGIDSTSYSLRHGTLNTAEVVFLEPLRNSRKKSVKGLTQSVKEMGIVNPVHVMVSEAYSDWLAEETDELFTGNKYVMLDGFRRMYAALRNGIEEIEAVIWEFKDPEYGNEVSLVLSLIINKSQKRTWEEVWNLYQVLEARSAMAPSTLEYLLEIDSGDAMKLKDVAMATMYPDVWMSLIDGEKTLDQAYNNLKKLRKEEDRASIEDGKGISEYEDSEGIVGDHSNQDLTDEEAREILEISNSVDNLEFGGDEEDEDMLGLNEGELQSTSERKPLDPVLRNAILRRDDFTCQTCQLGAGITSGIALGVFEIHHTTAVYNGLESSRDDTGNISEDSDIPKLLTTCSTCHKLIHLVVRQNGKLGITKEEFDELPDSEKDKWKQVGKYAKVLLWAEKKSGKKAQRSEPIKLPQNKPFWEIEKENREALALGEQVEKYGREYASNSSDS